MPDDNKKYICIHGHFYQPPRENAWLEVIETQDSAHPYHDWNERITAECYEPNSASRILDSESVIRNITNNYSRISFNFGPTLLSWMELNAKETYNAILQADKDSLIHFKGHGSAIAQVYNHIIMPLANRRDKETQIVWGIRDFEKRFKRKPEGMWLAETAVDLETLDLLVDNGITFTVLAPRQAKAVRKTGDEEWNGVNDRTVDTRKAYTCALPSGKSISVFFYNGDISQSIAFEGLLNDGRSFAENLINSFDPNDTETQLVHVATDGETYGHHHKHGEMALAFCLDSIEKNKQVDLANYSYYLNQSPPQHEAQVIEYSSWSCVHGVERWRADCGCNSGGHSGWHQKWRKPLRDALDWLRDESSAIFEQEAAKDLIDPWQARNAYIDVILNRSEDNIQRYLDQHLLQETRANKILRLMEMQRHAMLMYTSCGWFFDEVSGIETTQVLQYACRVIQLASQTGGLDLESEFIRRLDLAPSNIAAYETAAQVYRKDVLPSRTNLQRVGMHYAVSSLFEEEPESLIIFNYATSNDFFIRKEAGEQKLALGITKVKSLVTKSEKKFAFAVVCIGVHNIIGNISLDMDPEKFGSMQLKMVTAFNEGRLGDVIGLMQTFFGPEKYTIWQLFEDEKRKILDQIAQESLQELEESLRRTYNRDYPLVNALVNNSIPIPNAYRTTFEYILNADLIDWFQAEKINIKELERITGELVRWNMKIEDTDKIARMAGESILKEIGRVREDKDNLKRIQRLNRLFPVLSKFQIESNLHNSQNLYFKISTENKEAKEIKLSKDWLEQFYLLGENLGVKVE